MDLFNGVYRGRRVLLTGHTGFKGSWLTSWLIRLGAEVCGLSDGVPTVPSLFEAASLRGQIRSEACDIRDVAAVKRIVDDFRPDFVFHLAAQAIVSKSYSNPVDTISTNVIGTASILNALRAVDWPCIGIIITSDKAYFNVEWLWGYRENDRLGGKDIYSGSKGAAELIFESFFHSFFSKPGHPVKLATARAGNVIGGGDWAQDRIVADCIRSWKESRPVQIRSPRATRPWQHVLEPLSGYLTLGATIAKGTDIHGASYNFGPRGEQNATVLELLSGLAVTWGYSDPADAFTITNDIPFHEASLLKLNIDKAMAELSWLPTLTYDECVDMTGGWYRDVVKYEGDAGDVTQAHLTRYEQNGIDRNRVWAR